MCIKYWIHWMENICYTVRLVWTPMSEDRPSRVYVCCTPLFHVVSNALLATAATCRDLCVTGLSIIYPSTANHPFAFCRVQVDRWTRKSLTFTGTDRYLPTNVHSVRFPFNQRRTDSPHSLFILSLSLYSLYPLVTLHSLSISVG